MRACQDRIDSFVGTSAVSANPVHLDLQILAPSHNRTCCYSQPTHWLFRPKMHCQSIVRLDVIEHAIRDHRCRSLADLFGWLEKQKKAPGQFIFKF